MNTEAPRRLTLADAYRDAQAALTAALSRTAAEPSASVEISRNAKGDVQHSVKVYATASADPAEVRSATDNAYDQAVQAFDSLSTAYPFVAKPEPEKKTK